MRGHAPKEDARDRGLRPRRALAPLRLSPRIVRCSRRLDRSYYGAIERGEFNVSLSTILKIASGLDTTAAGPFRRAKL